MWGAAMVVAALLPLVISVGNSFLFSQICIYAVIALSLTVLTGWAGQVSLGQFGLVAIGALLASHLETSLKFIPLMLLAGAVTAVIAVLVGLPALRVRGLYLAVSTLAFGLWFMEAVLGSPCWTLPWVHKELCTGLPNPQSTLLRAELSRHRSGVGPGLCLVLARAPGGVHRHRAAVAGSGSGPSPDRRA